MRFLTEQQFASAAEDRSGRHGFDRSVIPLCDIEILVVLPNIHVDYVLVLVDDGLNIRLMKSIVQGKAVEAPACAEYQQYALVIPRSGLNGIGNFLFCIRIAWIELAQPR
jgi:hypothetical protein